ncbi:hypothetical protein B0H11DRAFT_2072649 [Mycena galericulata]|nr:hypothetical protein B0H11DRAFT_2072649 [Mycena galericulata]
MLKMRRLLALGLVLNFGHANAIPAPDYTVTVVDAASFNEYGVDFTISPIGTAANGAVTTYELSQSADDEIATLIEGSAGYTLTFSNGDGFTYTAGDQCIFTAGTVADCNRQNGLFSGGDDLFSGGPSLTAGTEAVQAIATFTVSGNPLGPGSSATRSGPSSAPSPSATGSAPASRPPQPSQSTSKGFGRYITEHEIATVIITVVTSLLAVM